MTQLATAPLTLTTETFAPETAEGVAVVDFWAAWCPPCRVLGPTIDELASDLGDSALVAKVNVDEEPQLAETYGVQSIPTVLFLRDGQEVARSVGAVPKAALLEHLEAARGTA